MPGYPIAIAKRANAYNNFSAADTFLGVSVAVADI